MGVAEELEKAQGLLASGDISGLLRHLRAHGEALPLGEVARLVAGAARLAGFDDLAQAAAAVAEGGDASGPQDARALYDFGSACIERGIGYLAVRPLARALELAPDAAPVLSELVAALEHDGQHARAVAVLEEHESVMRWLHRFQYVYNALMAGDLDKAAEVAATHTRPSPPWSLDEVAQADPTASPGRECEQGQAAACRDQDGGEPADRDTRHSGVRLTGQNGRGSAKQAVPRTAPSARTLSAICP